MKALREYELLLASGSPRRRELMTQLGLPFRVVKTGHGDEVYPPGLEAEGIALYLARHKSYAYEAELGPKQVLLTADTIVWHEGRELGKPEGPEEAFQMLRNLAAATHQVFTGVCLRTASEVSVFSSETSVRFSSLSDEEIRHYIRQYAPFDKAGAYGIQEWIGHIAVEYIEGSYFNVIGLPVQRVYHELKQILLSKKK